MKLWLVALLLFGACTSAPRQKSSEAALDSQAKAIEQAADKIVNETSAEFDIDQGAQDGVAANATIN